MQRLRAFIALMLMLPVLAFGQSMVYRFPGQIQSADGTVSLPQYSWSSDPNTGLYRIGADQIGFATGGVLRAQADATGFTVPAGQLFSASGGGTLTGTFAGAVTWSGAQTFSAGAAFTAGGGTAAAQNIVSPLANRLLLNASLLVSPDSINIDNATNGAATTYINYFGYAGGATQFRTTVIADGKGTAVATFAPTAATISVPTTFSSGLKLGSVGPGTPLGRIAYESAINTNAAMLHHVVTGAINYGVGTDSANLFTMGTLSGADTWNAKIIQFGSSAATINVATTLGVVGNANTIYGGVTYNNGSSASDRVYSILANTADASDNHGIEIASGGVAGPTRGGYIRMFGNEADFGDSLQGTVEINSGYTSGTTGANITIRPGNVITATFGPSDTSFVQPIFSTVSSGANITLKKSTGASLAFWPDTTGASNTTGIDNLAGVARIYNHGGTVGFTLDQSGNAEFTRGNLQVEGYTALGNTPGSSEGNHPYIKRIKCTGTIAASSPAATSMCDLDDYSISHAQVRSMSGMVKCGTAWEAVPAMNAGGDTGLRITVNSSTNVVFIVTDSGTECNGDAAEIYILYEAGTW